MRRFLSEAQIDDILKRYKAGEVLKSIARTHNIAVSTISDLARRNNLPKREAKTRVIGISKHRFNKGV